jgi:hypothetical protein
MFLFRSLALAVAITFTSIAMPVMAASSTASLVYDSIGRLVGSLSDSVNRSSNSSSNGGRVAGGQYKLIEVAVAPDQPGVVSLKMQALAGAEGASDGRELVLSLPLVAFEKSGLIAGDMVAARERTYGIEFANGKTQLAFFLVLKDETYRELVSNPVVL